MGEWIMTATRLGFAYLGAAALAVAGRAEALRRWVGYED